MKIPGILAVFAAFLGLGITQLRNMKREMRCLDGLARGVTAIRAELASRLCPMDELLTTAAERAGGEAGLFFHCVLDSLTELNTRSFSALWTDACSGSLPALSEENRRQLEALGGMLGRYGVDEQMAACDSYLRFCLDALEDARDHYPERRRLSLALSAAAGIFLCLLIL